MKPLMNKLRQRTGASMLIALVFMLFCVFVGGSVLTAATANSARMQRKADDDQEYLTLRSAAALLIDELRPTVRNGTQMSVLLDTSETFPDDDEDADPVLKTTVVYSLTNNRNELRELAYLCAACRYCSTHVLSPDDTDFSAFSHFGRDPILITPALTVGDSTQSDFTLTLALDGGSYPLTARMVCDRDYNISVYFLTDGEINDKLHIEMNTSYFDDFDEMLSVIWEAPVIVKGGAAA